jgi:hypothetical protein
MPPAFSATEVRDHTVIVGASPPEVAPGGTASSPSARDLGDDAPVVSALETGEELDGLESDSDAPSESVGLTSTKTRVCLLSSPGKRWGVVVDGVVSCPRTGPLVLVTVVTEKILEDQ